jgi:capsular exopolysaccharide synthesis family protein
MSSVRYESPAYDADLSPASAQASSNSADATLSEAWVTIRKRKWIILAAVVLGAVYGFYQGTIQPRVYVSSGTIEIRSGSSNEFRVGGASATPGETTRLPTQVAILKSDTLMLAVARDLNLANSQAFVGAKGPFPFRNIDDPAVRQSTIAALQGDVTVEAMTKTDLIRISCTTLDPKLSSDIVNKLVEEYILRSFQSRADATQRVTRFFAHQLDDLKQEVLSNQEQMIDLQKKLGVVGFDPTNNSITSSLSDLTKALNAAQIARIAAETHYRVLSGMGRDAIPLPQGTVSDATGRDSGAVATMRSQIDTARAALAELNANLGPNHPQVKAARDQLAELNRELHEEQDRVLSNAREAYVAAKAEEDQTRAVLAQQTADEYKLRDDLVEYTIRQREYDSNRTLYESLLQRLRTAGVQAGLESTEIDIVDTAVPAIAPSLRSRTTMMVVDGFALLIAGLILAFLLDSLDTGLRSVAEIEAISGLPSLALIPRTRRSTSEHAKLSAPMRNLGVLTNPKSQFAEAFRALRTSLLLSVAGGEPRVILLTSATPSEGKTTVSTNLACVLAQRDVRVLLIDADLRRPTVHHRLGLNGKVGLTSVLTGSVTLEQAIQHIPEVPTLDVLVSGPVPPFPTEMLGSESMRQLLDHARGIYTHIVVDSPPLLSVTDSVVLARDADAIVLVLRHGKSSKFAVRRARDLLVRSGARITGLAVNAVDLNSPEYYAYYGYYGYSGYASAGVDSAGWESKDDEPPRSRDGGYL